MCEAARVESSLLDNNGCEFFRKRKRKKKAWWAKRRDRRQHVGGLRVPWYLLTNLSTLINLGSLRAVRGRIILIHSLNDCQIPSTLESRYEAEYDKYTLQIERPIMSLK